MNIDGVIKLASGKYALGAKPSYPKSGGAKVALLRPNKRGAWSALLSQQGLKAPRKL